MARRVVVIHAVNGTTKTAGFEAPLMSTQAMSGVLSVDMFDEAGDVTGYAKFTAGMVLLADGAIGQYQPLTCPEEAD